jgi:MFS family permease
MASNGIVLNTFNLYLPEFAKEFNVDIGKATGLAATLYLVLALPLPFVGNLLEKFSTKKIILIGAFGVSAGLYYLSTATSFKMIQLFVIVYPLFLCLVGLLTSMYVINNWFVKYKGIATGILLMASRWEMDQDPGLAGGGTKSISFVQLPDCITGLIDL